jgi:4-amino-4-deoxy-L-arabinose transferase-like glycosyltransferase
MVLAVLVTGLLLLLCVPVFEADRPPVNSDQSLYLAEALNIAEGKGITYPTGEPVTHRAPLYPAMLAGIFKASGTSLDSAYVLPRVTVFANVLLVAALARLLFGNGAGLAAGVMAAISPFIRGIGTTLYLDSTLCSFFLASMLLLAAGQAKQSWKLHAAAGAMLGASFLTKETAVLFLPLPVALSLMSGFEPGWKRAFAGWGAGFAAVTAWWWVWVYAQTGNLFLIGPATETLGLMLLGSGVIAGVACAAALRLMPSQIRPGPRTWLPAIVLMVVWNAAFLYGLDKVAYNYDSDYLGNGLTYLRTVVAGNVTPFPLIVAAWLWLSTRAVTRSRAEMLVLLPALLSVSWTLLVSDRLVSLRDLLPLIYLSYVALGAGAAALVRWAARYDLPGPALSPSQTTAVVTAAAIALWAAWNGAAVTQEKAVAPQDDWNNALVAMTADWIDDNIPAGATIMSSRLYYSQVYFETQGRNPIHQLPTVEVGLNTSGDGPPLTRLSTLFRWENHLLPADSPDDRWLYLTYYPKGYFVGLAENDLLTELRRRDVDYVLISTYDAGFSSPSFNRYFEGNPGFELVKVISLTQADEVRIYRVNQDELGPQKKPAEVRRSAIDYLDGSLGAPGQLTNYLARLNPYGFETVER